MQDSLHTAGTKAVTRIDDDPYSPPAVQAPEPGVKTGWKQWWLSLDRWKKALLLSGAWLVLVLVCTGLLLIVLGPMSDARKDVLFNRSALFAGVGVGICLGELTPWRRRRRR